MTTDPARPSDRSPEEQAFLDAYDPSAFEHPSLAVDVVLLTVIDGALRVLLIRRVDHPARGRWSLPGTFVGMTESLDAAATRVLEEKTGLRDIFVEQLYTFGAPGRDPRTRVVSVTYYALVDPARLLDAPGVDNGDRCLAPIIVPWSGETGGAVTMTDDAERPMPIAFDHDEIISVAVKRMRGKLNYSRIGFELLPDTFTLRRLQGVHETILGRVVNKDAFRRRMLATGLLEATGEREREVGHRPAERYRFT